MKNLRNVIILSVVVMLAIVFGVATDVNASSAMLFNTNTTTNPGTTAGATGTNTSATGTTPRNTSTFNNSGSASANRTANKTSNLSTNKDKQNTSVTNSNKDSDLPQTGENDVYIISAIGVVALVIGGVAFAKSRKYDA